MAEQRGYIHLYCGDGKGKTTAALGLALRAAGRGYKVLIARFLKTEDSGEVIALKKFEGITLIPCEQTFGFAFRMKEMEREKAALYYTAQFRKAAELVVSGGYRLLILDEILAACRYQMVQEQEVLDFLEIRPSFLEIVLTGRDPSEAMCEKADYITEMKMRRHPYERGTPARKGIEF